MEYILNLCFANSRIAGCILFYYIRFQKKHQIHSQDTYIAFFSFVYKETLSKTNFKDSPSNLSLSFLYDLILKTMVESQASTQRPPPLTLLTLPRNTTSTAQYLAGNTSAFP